MNVSNINWDEVMSSLNAQNLGELEPQIIRNDIFIDNLRRINNILK
jgi:hypothetical protein